MNSILIVVHVIIIVLLISVVLIQRSSSGFTGLSRSAPSEPNKFGGLAKATTLLAILFFCNSILLAVSLGGPATDNLVIEDEPAEEALEPDISGND